MWKVLCAFVLLLWGVSVPLFERHIKQWPEGRTMLGRQRSGYFLLSEAVIDFAHCFSFSLVLWKTS